MEVDAALLAEDWRSKYLAWIDQGELPSDRSEVRRITRKAKSLTVIDGELYKRVASGTLQ
jgi:bifunctional pyridoxal-dependent enzyme with beta-cystathionase and maltose regulon repressor activities